MREIEQGTITGSRSRTRFSPLYFIICFNKQIFSELINNFLIYTTTERMLNWENKKYVLN